MRRRTPESARRYNLALPTRASNAPATPPFRRVGTFCTLRCRLAAPRHTPIPDPIRFAMTAQLIDGNALSKTLRADVAARGRPHRSRTHTGTRRRAGRRQSGERSLCAQQGEGVPGQRPAFGVRPLPRVALGRRTARAHRHAERRSVHPRHPRAIAAARAHRQSQGHRGDCAGEGRRRLSRRQCGRAHDRQAALSPVHAVWRDEDVRSARHRSQGRERGGHRPLEHRRQADGAPAARSRRDRHHLSQQDARSREARATRMSSLPPWAAATS